MSLGILGTSVGQIWFAPLQKNLNLDSLQMLFHTSPIVAFCCFVLTPVVEDTSRLMDVDLTFPLVLNLFGSSLMAFFLNLSGYIILQHTSPLTYQVVGHVKTVLVLLLGMLYFERLPSNQVVIGILVSMSGFLLYNFSQTKTQSHSVGGTTDESSENYVRTKVQEEHASSPHNVTFIQASAQKSPKMATQGRHKSNDDILEGGLGVHRRSEPHENSVALQELFDRASNTVADKTTSWSSQPAIEDKTQMYALFKLVRSGACTDDSGRPSVFDPVARAKWDAWRALGDKHSREEAQNALRKLSRKVY